MSLGLRMQPKAYFMGMDKNIRYAVVYDSHVDSVEYEIFYIDYIRTIRKEENYECVDFFSEKDNAIKRAEELPKIANRKYTLKAVLEKNGSKIIKIM